MLSSFSYSWTCTRVAHKGFGFVLGSGVRGLSRGLGFGCRVSMELMLCEVDDGVDG